LNVFFVIFSNIYSKRVRLENVVSENLRSNVRNPDINMLWCRLIENHIFGHVDVFDRNAISAFDVFPTEKEHQPKDIGHQEKKKECKHISPGKIGEICPHSRFPNFYDSFDVNHSSASKWGLLINVLGRSVNRAFFEFQFYAIGHLH